MASTHYLEIHKRIDSMVGKHGSEKVAMLLGKLDSTTNGYYDIINTFIKYEICNMYSCSESELETSKSNDVNQYRSIAYYLLKKCCNLSVRRICRLYNKHQPSVHNGIKYIENICESKKTVVGSNRETRINVQALSVKTKEFIEILNKKRNAV